MMYAFFVFLLFGAVTFAAVDSWFGADRLGLGLPASPEVFEYAMLGAGLFATAAAAYAVYAFRERRRIAPNAALAREMALAREQLRRLYDQGPVAHCIIDARGIVRNPNMAALRLFKREYDALEGVAAASLVAPDDTDEWKGLAAKIRHEVPFDKAELRVVRGDSTVRTALVSVFPISVPGFHGAQGLATFIDITEAKELEEAKTQFVSLASHQLRTPLSTIKWYVEMLTSGDLGALSDKQRAYLEKIETSNTIMIDLVATLLDVSRVEMGRLQTERQAVDLPGILESVREELFPSASAKRIEISVSSDEAVRTVESDGRLLRVIVQNLISNAVKYTPDGGSVTVTVSGSPIMWRLSVADTGYGIPPEERDRIFTKMFRGSNVRSLQVDGNGLGLYLTKKLTELLGGSISFTSEVGKGTVFTVTFP